MMDITAGIDVGKGYIKVYDGETWYRYPSFYSISDGIAFAQSSAFTAMVLKNRTYLLVNNGSGPPVGSIIQPRDDSKTSGVEMLLHVLNVVAAAYERRKGRGKDEVCVNARVSLGLPISNYEAERDALRAKLQGEHQFSRNGRQFRVNLTPSACREGLGAYLSMVMNEKGQLVNKQLFDSLVAVIDIGHRTTDTVLVRSGRSVPDGCKSFIMGIFDIQGSVERHVSSTHGALADTDQIRIFEWLSGGPVPKIRRHLLDENSLIQQRDKALEDFSLIFEERVLRTLKPLGVEEIFITGGGAEMLRTHLQQMDSTIQLTRHPQFANVIGFYRSLML